MSVCLGLSLVHKHASARYADSAYSLGAAAATTTTADVNNGRLCGGGRLVDLRGQRDAALDLHGPRGRKPGAPGEGELQSLSHVFRFIA